MSTLGSNITPYLKYEYSTYAVKQTRPANFIETVLALDTNYYDILKISGPDSTSNNNKVIDLITNNVQLKKERELLPSIFNKETAVEKILPVMAGVVTECLNDAKFDS